MACDQTNWTISESGLGDDDVRALLDLHFAEMRTDSPPEACHVLPADALRAPGIRLFAVREGATLLGVGALKTLDPGHGEIKSMRTHSRALGRGVGGFLLTHLIATARIAGMTRLSLETGNSALFAAANRLYERAGFTRTGPFGSYCATAFTHFYTRVL